MRSSLLRWLLPVSCVVLLVPALASARVTDATTGLSATGRSAGLSTACSGGASQCIATMVGRALNILFGFIGIVLLGYVLYGGFTWMTASGSKDVEQAQGIIRNAVIGVVIIACSFAISSFVLTQLGQISAGINGTSGGSSADTTGGTTVGELMDGATRQCCYADATPTISCVNDCQRTPTAFGLTAPVTEDACLTACGSRICPLSGDPARPRPAPGQSQCTPGVTAGPTPARFNLATYCTALGAEPRPVGVCDTCVRDCAARSICTPGDALYVGGRILSEADAAGQRTHCREVVCTMGTSPACAL